MSHGTSNVVTFRLGASGVSGPQRPPRWLYATRARRRAMVRHTCKRLRAEVARELRRLRWETQ